MMRILCASLACVMVAGSACADDGVRFWTDNTGTFSVRAGLVEFDQADRAVTLKLADGDHVVVPLRRLSLDDRTWLDEYARGTRPNSTEIAGIRWFADLQDAQHVAAGTDQPADDKPILCFRALGNLSGFM